MPWNCVGTSVLGANHKRKNIPMQDAYMSMIDGDRLYVSVADGHGSQVCFRSDVGSTLAVTSTIEVVRHHSKQICAMTDTEERKIATKNLSQAIVAYWSKKVLEHLRGTPFNEAELSKLDEPHMKQLSKNALLAYGTTLMLVVCRKNIVFGFSIGDGDVLAEKDSESRFLTEFNKTQGEATYSLCTPNVSTHVKYFETDSSETDCLLVSTDGYRNSFASLEDFKKVVTDMKSFITEEGQISLSKKLDGWLEETSEQGSGDDITACFLYNRLLQ